MSRPAEVLIACFCLFLLAGCVDDGRTKPTPPPGVTHTVTERVVYVSIRPELTQKKPIPEGPLRDVVLVAAQRKADLLACYAKLDEIAAIEGTPVEAR